MSINVSLRTKLLGKKKLTNFQNKNKQWKISRSTTKNYKRWKKTELNEDKVVFKFIIFSFLTDPLMDEIVLLMKNLFFAELQNTMKHLIWSITGKIPYGKKLPTAKNPYVENSVRRKFLTAKFPYGEKSYVENSYGEISCHAPQHRWHTH